MFAMNKSNVAKEARSNINLPMHEKGATHFSNSFLETLESWHLIIFSNFWHNYSAFSVTNCLQTPGGETVLYDGYGTFVLLGNPNN